MSGCEWKSEYLNEPVNKSQVNWIFYVVEHKCFESQEGIHNFATEINGNYNYKKFPHH